MSCPYVCTGYARLAAVVGFAKDDMTSLPFTFLGLDPVEHASGRAAVVVLPVPYGATASFKAGAQEGPEAIIAASRELEDYDPELACEPCSAGIHTAPALEPHLAGPREMVERVREAVRPIARAGKLLALLGGDHSVSIGASQAMAEARHGLSVLYLDAHADFRDQYQGTRWGHASAARRIAEVCPVTLAGVRSMALEEAQALKLAGVRVFPGPLAQEPWDAVVEALSPTVYVSLDLDVLDPGIMPAVGTPEPGGMGWYQILTLLRRVAERRHIVGFDLVELAPREGPASCAYLAAKLAYKLMGYATVLGR
ncbi:MAG: agmatinase [Chloroflexi bacterium]|nr:agmatinase [Chloroflexota bacterium]